MRGSAPTCPWCAAPFTPTKPNQLFCARAHKLAFHQLERTRGARLATLAMAWRLGRNTISIAGKATAKEALAEMCRLADLWNAEDRAAGRPTAIKVYSVQRALFLR